MSEAIDKVWREIWKRWGTSNSISRFSWDCETVAREHPELEERAFRALANENRFLVANCLIMLEAMKSCRLSALPKELFERHDRLTVIRGSFGQDFTLARLAREIVTKFEQDGAANRSQPIPSEVNQTPPAAGPGR